MSECDKNKFNLYEIKSNELSYIINDCYSLYHSKIKLNFLEQMIELSLKLSEGFIYTRISFHIFNKNIYFSDISFASTREIDIIKSKNLDRKLGSLIKLPKIVYNIDIGKYCSIKKIFPLYSFLIFFIILILKSYKLFKNNF